MQVRILIAGAAIVAGLGVSGPTSGSVAAAPPNLPSPSFFQPDPGDPPPPPGIPAEKCWRYGRSGGGSPRGGGGMPGYLPQCPVGGPPPG
jgi:hypothetical protein